MKKFIILTSFLCIVSTLSSWGQVATFTYQGRLTDTNGPVNGTIAMAFRVYETPTGGTLLWEETHASVPINSGLFVVTLGQTAPVDAMLFDGSARWLGISVNGGVELSPRQAITATPYAFHALNAANLMSFANTPLDIKVDGYRALRLEPPTSGEVNIIGGSAANTVVPGVSGATISGGGMTDRPNVIFGGAHFGSIGGGYFNTIDSNSPAATIGGGYSNTVGPESEAVTIAGGFGNIVFGPGSDNSVIGGGWGNTIEAGSQMATIAGGYFHRLGTNASNGSIGGGYNNGIFGSSIDATIAGGRRNTVGVNASGSTIGGGEQNTVLENSVLNTIAGGVFNSVGTNSHYNAIGGGGNNNIGVDSRYGTIAGGDFNSIGSTSPWSTIAGGRRNVIEPKSDHSSIGGGNDNLISVNSSYSTIGGGRGHNISHSSDSTIGGGSDNRIAENSLTSTIAGGDDNSVGANAAGSTIGGGGNNNIESNSQTCTIAGGAGHDIRAFSFGSTISGGRDNQIGTNSRVCFIGGGYGNEIAANSGHATIPGGERSFATNRAFAAGSFARAAHSGSFVWADSFLGSIASTNEDSVTMRANGGYRLYSHSNLVAGVFLAPGSGTWTVMSDRNAKENFEPVNPQAVLDKVVALPVSTWNYKSQSGSVRHIGPMAQDFKAAFGVGESDTGITTIDADGVALAAIQGLHQIVKEKDIEIQELKNRLLQLERLILLSNNKGESR